MTKKQSNEKCKVHCGCIRRRAPIQKQPDRVINMCTPDKDVPNNYVETTKYNLITFLPKNLLIQFSKSANMYFFIMGIWQMIPQITTTRGLPLVYMPLSVIIVISMLKDFIEDWRRRVEDNKENNKLVDVYRNGKFTKVKSQFIRIGDVIRIKEDEYFPADIIMLQVPERKNIAYIETKNLDGETNLKVVSVHQQCQANLVQLEDYQKQKLQFNYEKPSLMMYKFTGYFHSLIQGDNDKKHNVDINNFICRGSCLRNVSWVTGLVVYSGHDTKIMLNSIGGKYKTSNVEKQMNQQVLFIFALLVFFSVFAAAYSAIWTGINNEELKVYIDGESNSLSIFLLRLPQWLLLLSNFVPISLLVTIEMVKLGQSLFISTDYNFKYKGQKATNNSSNLMEQLGLVNYIFSDKTGTLTSNLMRFKSFSAGSIAYGDHQKEEELDVIKEEDELELEVVDFHDLNFKKHFQNPQSQNYNNIIQCLTCINLCHTIHAEIKDDMIKYVAQSPDEFALVTFASEQNFQYQGKNDQGVMYIRHNDKIIKYKLLETLEFSYERKRMSVIVQDLQTNEIILYTKGADQIVYQLLDQHQVRLMNKTTKILEQFSEKGLRTLCLARKKLSQEQYNKWQQDYQKVQTSLDSNRKIQIEKVQEQIEQNLELIGTTAIEDKLQDDIAHTIELFKIAGIQTWMLTGDKIETAINIGKNCSLISPDSQIIVLNQEEDLDQKFQEAEAIVKHLDTNENSALTLVISGQGFEYIKKNEEKLDKFAQILIKCETVLGCRVTPKEKQEFVCLIKKTCPKSITLAVGDGANDVSMITEAHVGVGIQGIEGREAAKASDFAIGQFRFLRRLLFYHGQEAYRKNSQMIFFNFYKNQSWILTTFFFGFYSGFTGQYLYDQVMQQFFNLFFVALPIILYTFFDELYPSNDYLEIPMKSQNQLEMMPLKYLQNQENQIFCKKNFWIYFFKGAIHSSIMVIIAIYTYAETFPYQDGYVSDFYLIGMYVYTLAVIVNNIKVILMHKTHYGFTLMLNVGSTVLYFVFFYALNKNESTDSHSQLQRIALSYNTYFGLILCLAVTSLFDFAMDIFEENFLVDSKYQNNVPEKKMKALQSLSNSIFLNNSSFYSQFNMQSIQADQRSAQKKNSQILTSQQLSVKEKEINSSNNLVKTTGNGSNRPVPLQISNSIKNGCTNNNNNQDNITQKTDTNGEDLKSVTSLNQKQRSIAIEMASNIDNQEDSTVIDNILINVSEKNIGEVKPRVTEFNATNNSVFQQSQQIHSQVAMLGNFMPDDTQNPNQTQNENQKFETIQASPSDPADAIIEETEKELNHGMLLSE